MIFIKFKKKRNPNNIKEAQISNQIFLIYIIRFQIKKFHKCFKIRDSQNLNKTTIGTLKIINNFNI